MLEKNVNNKKNDENLRYAYKLSSRKRKINFENNLKKHHVQSLKKKKKNKIGLRAEINVIVEFDIEISLKRRKTSNENVTKIITI